MNLRATCDHCTQPATTRIRAWAREVRPGWVGLLDRLAFRLAAGARSFVACPAHVEQAAAFARVYANEATAQAKNRRTQP